jgi:uncharacterized membrane protein
MDPPTRPEASWWLGIAAPSVAFVAFVGSTVLAFAFGLEPVVFVLLVPLLLFVGVVSLYCFYRDTRLVALADTEWKPAVWKYIGAGAVTAFALVLAPAIATGTLTLGLLPVLVAVAVALSGVFFGPVYLWRRYNRFETLTVQRE